MIPFFESVPLDLRTVSVHSLTFPPHLHNQLELLFLDAGSLEVTVGQNTRLLNQGDLAVIFPGLIHSYRTPEGECERHYLLNIAAPSLAGESAALLQKFHPEIPFLPRERLHPDVPHAMRVFSEEISDRTVCSAYLQVVLSRVLPLLSLARNTEQEQSDLTYRLVTYLSQHYTQPLTLSAVANALHISPYYLSHIFSCKLRTGFNQYLNSLRTASAQQLLLTSDLPVTQVAFDCGFESQRTFNRAFLQAYGVSPREYRKTSFASKESEPSDVLPRDR